MNEVLQQQLDFARNSGLKVEVDDLHETVAMTVNGEDLCFMQGQEASEFAEKVMELWDQEGDINTEYCELIIAYPYLDLAS